MTGGSTVHIRIWWSRDDDDTSGAVTRLSPEGLEHGELPGKLQQGHGVEVRRVRSWEATPLTLPVLLGATQT